MADQSGRRYKRTDSRVTDNTAGRSTKDSRMNTVKSQSSTAGKGIPGRQTAARTTVKDTKDPLQDLQDEKLKQAVIEELRRREKRRRCLIALCLLLAFGSLGYFCVYSYMTYQTESISSRLSFEKDKTGKSDGTDDSLVIHKTGKENAPAILSEYQDLYNQNQSLIGWIKVDGTNINYPVLQAQNNEYYLTHNFDQDYDKNGSVFLDSGCDILNRSTNLIVYGHHMKSGSMFGQLDFYADQNFYEKHKTFAFDTIYERGIYEVAYVFRSQVYTKDEITFKYYQFINANSKAEFDSDMLSMAKMSLYDTGITPVYGNQLVTLSTCDHTKTQEGRFVVVGIKIS